MNRRLAEVAQWQSNGIVNRRLEVQLLSSAPDLFKKLFIAIKKEDLVLFF